jgi:hypothetical protein
MNRLFRAAMVAAILPAGLASAGCMHGAAAGCGNGNGNGRGHGGGGHGCIDPAWPDRYNYAARQAVVAPFAQQVATGHFLHQTLWNFYFEPGTDRLTPGGADKLDSLARTTPSPDPRIYIQTARDLATTPENLDKVASLRSDLDGRRAAVIKRYMTTQFGTPVPYEVYVHDAPVPSIYAPFVTNAFRGQGAGYQGGLSAGSIGAGSVGGGSGSGLPAGNTRSSSTSASTNVNTNVGGGGTGGPAPGGP